MPERRLAPEPADINQTRREPEWLGGLAPANEAKTLEIFSCLCGLCVFVLPIADCHNGAGG
jgi:hypothetical protein